MRLKKKKKSIVYTVYYMQYFGPLSPTPPQRPDGSTSCLYEQLYRVLSIGPIDRPEFRENTDLSVAAESVETGVCTIQHLV